MKELFKIRNGFLSFTHHYILSFHYAELTDSLDVEVAECHDRRKHSFLAFRRFGHEDDEAVIPRAVVDHVLVFDAVHQSRHLEGQNLKTFFRQNFFFHGMVIFQKQPAFGFIPVLQINGMKNEEIQTQIQSTEIERRERKAYLPQTQFPGTTS